MTGSMSEETLRDLTSRDSHRIWKGAWAIIETREPRVLDPLAAALPDIERTTVGVELGGALRPNQEVLEHAIRKLRVHGDQVDCLCSLYPDFLSYNPRHEEERGHVRIHEHQADPGGWAGTHACQCAYCDRSFRVRYGEMHMTWWKWTTSQQPD